MASLRPVFAVLIALFGSTAYADPPAVPRKYQAGFYLEGCKDFLAGRSNFLSGRCVGAMEVLNELGSDNKSFVHLRRSTTSNRCASSLRSFKVCRNGSPRVSGFWRMKRWQRLGRAKPDCRVQSLAQNS